MIRGARAAGVITVTVVLIVVALAASRQAQGVARVVTPASGTAGPTATPVGTERPLRVLLVGDSIMENTGDHVLEQLHRVYGDAVVVRVEGHNGSGLLGDSPVDWGDTLDRLLRDFDPDVVVGLFVGNYPSEWPHEPGPDGRPMLPDSAEYFAAWRAAAEDFTHEVTSHGSTMWWVTPPLTDRDDVWDTRTARNARTYREIAADEPGVGIIESADAIGGPHGGFVDELPDPETGEIRPVRQSDGIHLTSFGGRLLARTIADHLSGSATPPEPRAAPSHDTATGGSGGPRHRG